MARPEGVEVTTSTHTPREKQEPSIPAVDHTSVEADPPVDSQETGALDEMFAA